MSLECFVYTNGRSTYEHCISYLRVALKNVSLKKNSPKKVHIFQDRKLVDAMNQTLDMCQGTHFIKVDDDFLMLIVPLVVLTLCAEYLHIFGLA